MFDQLENTFNAVLPRSASGGTFVLSFLFAFVLSALMAWVYKVSSGKEYHSDIAHSQILLACIMAVVLMVVGDSVSRAFGAVGILSVIRFRSNVQNSAEAATLLSGVAVGMACGAGMLQLAVGSAVALSLVQVLLRAIFEPSAPREVGKKKKKDAVPAIADDASGGF
jgi:hypothetical protein